MSSPQSGLALRGTAADRIALPVPVVCDIEIVTTRSRFEALETEWNQLFERAAHPAQLFQSYNWLWHWCNHFLNEKTHLRTITGWHEGRLVMVWPLVEVKTFGLKKLIWMGEPVSQYGDALVEPGPLARDRLIQGWTQIRELGADFALLRKTRMTSTATIAIKEATACATAAAPVLEFGQASSFEDVLSRLPGKARSSRRRLWRRLMERGDITLKSPIDSEERAALVSEAFALKRRWLERRGRYSPAIESDATLSFFMDVAASEAHPVSMPIDAIYCGGQPIGIGLSLSCRDETLGHIIAHDEDFEKQGVGVVLAEHILKASFERGCARFDMLAPQDAYKMEWTDKTVQVHDWIMPFTWPGRLYVAAYVSDAWRALLERLKNLPPSAGQVVWPLLRGFKKIF